MITFRFDLCRNGPHWTWIIEGDGENIQGGAPTEHAAMRAARSAVIRIANGAAFSLERRNGMAGDVSLPPAGDAAHRARSQPTAADHALWERLQAAMRPVLPTAIDIAKLKTAMADAHPDRGGSSAAFILARAKYVAARRAVRGK